VPLDRPVAEVCAVAKRDLAAGERLEAIGETAYRAFTLTAADAIRRDAVPCGLLEGGKVIAPIRKGELITWRAAAPDPQSRLLELRRRQDRLIAAG
jgi:predicted homoserine dehydrogenase-like protein